MSTVIRIKDLVKEFTFSQRVKKTDRKIKNSKVEKKTVLAVDGISLNINAGESVGFIGPNGAGKSTTIKMLTGILYPTSGSVEVAGLIPSDQRQVLAKNIGCVFGQRSQLIYNLPARDSLMLFGKLYDVPNDELLSRIDELIGYLELEEFIDQPVRKMSLGQRMRSEIACSLVHNPEIIFLDEPTIGLDVLAKRNLRSVLRRLNQEKGTTLFLTSHDMGDIEALCDRTVIINHGRVVVDEKTEDLKAQYLNTKTVVIDFLEPVELHEIKGTRVVAVQHKQVELEVDLNVTSINIVLQEIMNKYKVDDIDIDKPDLESVIGMIFEEKKDASA